MQENNDHLFGRGLVGQKERYCAKIMLLILDFVTQKNYINIDLPIRCRYPTGNFLSVTKGYSSRSTPSGGIIRFEYLVEPKPCFSLVQEDPKLKANWHQNDK